MKEKLLKDKSKEDLKKIADFLNIEYRKQISRPVLIALLMQVPYSNLKKAIDNGK